MSRARHNEVDQYFVVIIVLGKLARCLGQNGESLDVVTACPCGLYIKYKFLSLETHYKVYINS